MIVFLCFRGQSPWALVSGRPRPEHKVCHAVRIFVESFMVKLLGVEVTCHTLTILLLPWIPSTSVKSCVTRNNVSVLRNFISTAVPEKKPTIIN